MTALIAPARSPRFEGLIFFVYDREAVKKEEDPPENAIVYFYPPSVNHKLLLFVHTQNEFINKTNF